ncbi:hypothetical protein C032_02175 [Brucella abortus 63/294]|nr:hypothetical protein C032_02175 [Brucella abortus 63/294]ENS08563.1 hypothetical protein C980_03057 [Brucella abortus 88/217]ERU04766.1 hypothetical protein P039_02024 [Brucella abortus 07-0994-2411]ERU05084.1 hypothetical protein P039_01865 [Brucella abortus 07-0994-2411]
MSLKVFLQAGVACAALSLAGAAGASAEPLKIALVETLSGPQASTGLLYRAAVLYQLGKINEAAVSTARKSRFSNMTIRVARWALPIA